MLEVCKKNADGVTMDIWDVSVGLTGSGSEANVHCRIVGFRRQSRARGKQWITIEFWSACIGPECRMPLVPAGATPPRKLEHLPTLPDGEVLAAVQKRMKVVWP